MILSISNIKKTVNYFKNNGMTDTVYAAAERIKEKKKSKYTYTEPTEGELLSQRNESDSFMYRPLISIAVPTYETRPVFLEDMLLSCEEQSYTNFEIVIADASKTDFVERIVKDYNKQYGNIIYKRIGSNDGIAENTNRAIAMCNGDYIGLLDHDDMLTRDCLYYMVKAIVDCKKRFGDPVFAYSDEDKTDEYAEHFYEPHIKERPDGQLIMSNNYICHFSVFREDVIRNLKMRGTYDGAQDYDLILRSFEYAKEKHGDDYRHFILHVPHVCYHWRCHSESTAASTTAKEYAYENGRKALEEYVKKENPGATVSNLKHKGFYRVDYDTDIFTACPKVVAVGGPVIRNGHIVGGLTDRKGRVKYEGLNIHFSGYMHGAVLKHEADVLDIRNMVIRPEYEELFKQETGYSYPLDEDVRTSAKDGEMVRKSIAFCNKLKQKGIELMYDPQFDCREYLNSGSDAKEETE